MPRPLILFAPGAGAPSTSEWMTAWAKRLGTVGRVVRMDYPYMRAGRKAPDKLPVLIEAHREALRAARKRHRGPVVLAGKSMGSRVGCHLALEEPVDAVVCLGYPLVSPSKAVRDEVLRALRVPILFVQGTRDPLCPLATLKRVRRRMEAASELFVVEGGDHSLIVPKRSGKTQDKVDAEVLDAIATFVTRNAPARASGSGSPTRSR